ncbi:MAG TPA: RNA polymerase sigma factor [Gaiellaceae bacterium]|nr:RNA polymerase sigma factor [Gaiellaceae bacterium]
MRRAKDGDERALAALCERHAPRVERLARHVLRDPEDARDAAQESLAKLCVRIRQFRGESQFTTWLHRLTLNTCKDVAERRRARSTEPLGDDLREAPDGDPARAAALSELRAELCDALGELSPDQAQVLVLNAGYGYSFTEISDASGMPVGTAKSYAFRARARLRARLERTESAVA